MATLSKLTAGTESDGMGLAVEEMVNQALMRRRSHERRWYDNMFFDDGYHFRIISRQTGRVIDHISKTAGYVERAIPRASRQIRGVSNLMFNTEPYPVIYPARIVMEEFMQNGQLNQQAYQQALDQAKTRARLQGAWLSSEWEDEQHLFTKLMDMFMIAAKQSIAYLQVYSDTENQQIRTEVFDAFDIITFGDRRSLGSVPFITKVKSMEFDEVKSSSLFDEEKVKRLSPDNRYATSEIKEAYMRSRYGSKLSADRTNTILVKETFIKEYLSEDNWKTAIKLSADNNAMEGKSIGDQCMRHIYSAGGVTLADEYIDYDDYPFAEYRFEPGPLYQVPFIERFIPQNKSLDVIVTRLEKFVNTMVVGVYQQRKGENMQVSNFPGGQVLQYETTPLAQMQLTNPGNAPFQMVELLNKYIEEQGASTSVLGQIPPGVKAEGAIENLQQGEYSNLKMAILMQKRCMQRIAELMLERADKDFLHPVEVSTIENGQTNYFDVIGQRGLDLSNKLKLKLPPNIVPLSRSSKVRIEIEPGLGLTMAGKKQAMQNIIEWLMKLNDSNTGVIIGPEAMMQVVKKFVETFGYGSTEEFMEAVENGVTQGQLSKTQLQQMQLAVLQTLKDAQLVGPIADKKAVQAAGVGTLQALKDSGLAKHIQGADTPDQPVDQTDIDDDLTKIYDKAPTDIRRQIETKLGLQPSTMEPIGPTQADTATKLKAVLKKDKPMVTPANAV